jgi:chaperonin GroES
VFAGKESPVNLKPLRDRVLIKRVEEKRENRKGIIIPDTAKEKPMEGKVIAVGSGRIDEHGKRHQLEVKAGDRVLFGKYAGTEVRIDDIEHLILKEDEVLGIVR